MEGRPVEDWVELGGWLHLPAHQPSKQGRRSVSKLVRVKDHGISGTAQYLSYSSHSHSSPYPPFPIPPFAQPVLCSIIPLLHLFSPPSHYSTLLLEHFISPFLPTPITPPLPFFVPSPPSRAGIHSLIHQEVWGAL